MIPRLRNRIPHIYVEYSSVGVSGSAVISKAKGVASEIPTARLASLLLGPGTSITHEAIKICAKDGCQIVWVGADSTRLYAAGDPLAGDPVRLQQQVACATNPKRRARAVRYMFQRRFGETLAPGIDENTARGMEGSRVKGIYATLASNHSVPWTGRKVRGHASDNINRALDAANGHLIQAATVAVLAAGFSPAIGLLHSGFDRAFACDVADLYKFDLTVPLAFRLVGEGAADINTDIRQGCRDLFQTEHLIDKMIRDSTECVNAGFCS